MDAKAKTTTWTQESVEAWGNQVSRALHDWSLSNSELPAGLTKWHLAAAMEKLSTTIEPASADQIHAALKDLFRFGRAFTNLRSEQIDDQTMYYFEHLGHLPADLLALAIHRTIGSWRYNSMPRPADILAKVDHEMIGRRSIITRVQMAMKYGRENRSNVARLPVREFTSALTDRRR